MLRFFDKSLGFRIVAGFAMAVLLSLIIFYALFLLAPVFTHSTGSEILRDIALQQYDTGRNGIFYMLSIQTICLFLVPAVVLLAAIYRNPLSALREQKADACRPRFWILSLAVLAIVTTNIPGINLLSELNTNGVLQIVGEDSQLWRNFQLLEQQTERLLASDSIFLSIICMAFVPAICEEVFFRGMMQRIAISVVKNRHLGVVCTAIIFSLMHGDLFNCVPRFVLGLFLGYIFLRTRNIFFPIIAHAMHNSWVVVFCSPSFPSSVETIGQTGNLLILGIASLGILAASFWLLLAKKG